MRSGDQTFGKNTVTSPTHRRRAAEVPQSTVMFSEGNLYKQVVSF